MTQFLGAILFVIGTAPAAFAQGPFAALTSVKQQVTIEGVESGGGVCGVTVCVANGRAYGIEIVQGKFYKQDACQPRRAEQRKVQVPLADVKVTGNDHVSTQINYTTAETKGAGWIEAIGGDNYGKSKYIKFEVADTKSKLILNCSVAW